MSPLRTGAHPALTGTAADAWRNRAPAERALLLVLALAVLLAAAYFAVIEPLGEASARLRARLPALAAERERVRAEAGELANRVPPARKFALDKTLVEAVLARHGLGPAGTSGAPAIDTTNENRLRVSLPRAPFFAIWPMLAALQNEQGIRVVALRVDRLDATHARVETVLAAGER